MRNRKGFIAIALVVLFLTGSGCSLLNKQNVNYSEKQEPEYSKQWFLENSEGYDINARVMWSEINRLPEHKMVVVAVIDTGIDYTHEDLQGAMWRNPNEIEGNGIDDDGNGFIDDVYGWNFEDNNNELLSREGYYGNDHGTRCAGIIAAQHNNLGIAGIAGKGNVKIMSLKVLSGIGMKGDMENVISAIQYAEAMGAKICNLSFTTEKPNDKLQKVIQDSNMLFVVAAGNNKYRGIDIDKKQIYPASYCMENVITVANLQQNGLLHETSNYGKEMVDIAAPGTNIYSTVVGNHYDSDTGTSMAVPMVSGVAALLYSYNKKISAAEVKNMILSSAKNLDTLQDKIKNGAILDAGKIFEN